MILEACVRVVRLNYPKEFNADIVEQCGTTSRLTNMQSKSVTIINKLGLHARAAARFVQLASGFDCDIYVMLNGKKVSGKSIMGIMMLAAAKDVNIEITATGPDEMKAVAELEELIHKRFGEEE